MSNGPLISKRYALGVINEIKQLGYSETNAKNTFLKHYLGVRRYYGVNLNVRDFANRVIEKDHILKSRNTFSEKDLIYVGKHTRNPLRKPLEKDCRTEKVFKISEEMEQKIAEWDSCTTDGTIGANLIYMFIPKDLGLMVKVRCPICKRELILSDCWTAKK